MGAQVRARGLEADQRGRRRRHHDRHRAGRRHGAAGPGPLWRTAPTRSNWCAAWSAAVERVIAALRRIGPAAARRRRDARRRRHRRQRRGHRRPGRRSAGAGRTRRHRHASSTAARSKRMLEVVDGMAFDRGYLSHHMVTDVERMQAVLDDPLHPDDRPQAARPRTRSRRSSALIADSDRPLLIIAEEVAPACVDRACSARRDAGGPPVAAIHPPEYGHWRKAMLEDIAIVTGGRVIARDLGGTLDQVELRDLGTRAAGARSPPTRPSSAPAAATRPPSRRGASRCARQIELGAAEHRARQAAGAAGQAVAAARRSSWPAAPRRSSRSAARS